MTTVTHRAPAWRATPLTGTVLDSPRQSLSSALSVSPSASLSVPEALSTALSAAVDALSLVPREPLSYRSVGDDELLHLTRLAAEEVRLAQLHVSLLAGEIARRSTPDLGSAGLAQRTGHRTPDELVRVTTGTRAVDARAAVRVGTVLGTGADGELTGAGDNALEACPASALGAAVLAGRVSVAVADAVTIGLGAPSPTVTAMQLDEAAARLLPRIEGLDADRAGREARAERDELDLAGLAAREEARREQRSLRVGRRADGMGYAHWVLDPETFAVVSEIYDRITSPKRTLPSFAGDGEQAGDAGNECQCSGARDGDAVGGGTELANRGETPRETGSVDDDRSPAQRASDTFVELLRQGVAGDTSQLLGDAPIGVRVITTARALDDRSGRGFIEGQPDAISIATVERHACSAGTVILTVDATPENAGQPLNLGRERRLFSRAQRLALAARDGGCRWPGCERPPSWCEAHHIEHWHRDRGRTDIADGLLLCRHHHLLAHNNGWEIRREGSRYLLEPPESGVSGAPPGSPRELREMPTKSRALLDALRE